MTPLNLPQRQTRAAMVASWLLVAAPLVSLGGLTGPAFALAAARLRSRWLAVSAGVYLAGAVVLAATAGSERGSLSRTVFGAVLAVNMLGGAAHALLIRGRVARGPELPSDPIVALAIARRERRRQARALLTSDPRLASDLGVGRPDVPREYDDGGLIDVNNVPVTVLAELPGITPDMAERILAVRDRPLGLSSVEDLIVYADIPPEVLEPLRDILVFPR